MNEHSAENDAPYDPCHGDPNAGWYGAHGTWEPCPVCDPGTPISPALEQAFDELVHETEEQGLYPPRPLPIHRTEAGYPRCSTCDGGGCLDCTDPA